MLEDAETSVRATTLQGSRRARCSWWLILYMHRTTAATHCARSRAARAGAGDTDKYGAAPDPADPFPEDDKWP